MTKEIKDLTLLNSTAEFLIFTAQSGEESIEVKYGEGTVWLSKKITDIYATSLDYDKNAEATREFFAKVQNKLHYAVHKHTAPELITKKLLQQKEKTS